MAAHAEPAMLPPAGAPAWLRHIVGQIRPGGSAEQNGANPARNFGTRSDRLAACCLAKTAKPR
jgi:hypothetical protein